jgi:hypothetical protein
VRFERAVFSDPVALHVPAETPAARATAPRQSHTRPRHRTHGQLPPSTPRRSLNPARNAMHRRRGPWPVGSRRAGAGLRGPAPDRGAGRSDHCGYGLRGSFVSLMLWEGRSVTYVAAQAGHSLQTLPRPYAGVLAELEDGDVCISATDAIRCARESVGRIGRNKRRGRRPGGSAEPGFGSRPRKPSAGLEPATPSLPSRFGACGHSRLLAKWLQIDIFSENNI